MKKDDLTPKDFLLHMVEAADRILEYTRGMNREQFLEQQMVQDAVVRNIEIMGEAANNALQAAPELAGRFSSVPFSQIYAMRKRLSHGYFSLSADMIWDTVELDIPDLRRKIAAIAAEMPADGNPD